MESFADKFFRIAEERDRIWLEGYAELTGVSAELVESWAHAFEKAGHGQVKYGLRSTFFEMNGS